MIKVYCETCRGGKKTIIYGCMICGGKGYVEKDIKEIQKENKI